MGGLTMNGSQNKEVGDGRLNLNIPSGSTSTNITQIRTANDCLLEAANQPELKQLFSTFWHSGEVAMLFADTGVGKSILAVQLAHYISAGLSNCCGMTNEAGIQTVLYYDFELSDRMFYQRYSNVETKETHRFSNRFFRVLLVSNGLETPETFEKQLFQAIEKDILETGASVIIVDNITALTMKTASDADTALLLMKQLKRFQMEKGLSILVLAHTTKIPSGLPIQLNHMGGSKHLSNFADSVFTIGRCADMESHRYLKQLKVRNAEMEYGQQQVLLLEKVKQLDFLGFNFVEFANERDLLAEPEMDNPKKEVTQQALALHKQNLSTRKIAEQLGIPKSNVARYIKIAAVASS
jgi:RecA-family ATPase